MEITCAPPVADPRKPKLVLPANSCDSHCHVYGPVAKFPYAQKRNYTPAEAPIESLERLWDLLGIQRAVIVQTTIQEDHAVVSDALRRGNGRYRGVALIEPTTPDSEMARFHEEGFRGTRLQFVPHLHRSPTEEEVKAIVDKVSPYGWHIGLHVSGDAIVQYEDLFASLPGQVVIDHMARVDLREGMNSPAIRAMKRLLDRENFWVKLSGTDRVALNPPAMDDSLELARDLAALYPDNVVWGTDHPHPNTHGFMPDEGDLIDNLAIIAPDEAARHKILVENPARLFDFPSNAQSDVA